VEHLAVQNGFADALDDVLMIVSELVSNAVLHGRAPLSMMFDYDRLRVLVEVRDGNAETSAVSARNPDAVVPGGRGLRIVDALAENWGTRLRATGKAVWATKRLTIDDLE
jgi:anti-sigma regulatory factor (Ser/Thr protein kinase)